MNETGRSSTATVEVRQGLFPAHHDFAIAIPARPNQYGVATKFELAARAVLICVGSDFEIGMPLEWIFPISQQDLRVGLRNKNIGLGFTI